MAIYQWGRGACPCIDGEGLLELPEDGALVVNPDPAQSGAIRLPNGEFIRARNAANDGDIDLLGSSAADEVLVGGTGAAAVELRAGAAVPLRATPSAVSASLPLELGPGTMAGSGTVRFGDGEVTTLVKRSSGVDTQFLAVPQGAGTFQLGANHAAWTNVIFAHNIAPLQLRHTGGIVWNSVLQADGAPNKYRISLGGIPSSFQGGLGVISIADGDTEPTAGEAGFSFFYAHANRLKYRGTGGASTLGPEIATEQFVSIGTTPATAGDLRFRSQFAQSARNAANDGDITVLSTNASDSVTVGGPAAGARPAAVVLDGDAVVTFRIGGADKASVQAGELDLAVPLLSFRDTVTSPVIGQDAEAGAGVSGDALTLQAQDATGSGTKAGGALTIRAGDASGGSSDAGGGLTLRSGSGSANQHGEVLIAKGTDYNIIQTSGGTLDVGATGSSGLSLLNLRADNTVQLVATGAARLQATATQLLVTGGVADLAFDVAALNPQIRQLPESGQDRSGDNLSIQAQDATGSGTKSGGQLTMRAGDASGGASDSGGALVLRSGAGSTSVGDIQITAGTATTVLWYSAGEAILGGPGTSGSRPTTVALDASSESALRVTGSDVLVVGSSLISAVQPLEVHKDAGTPAASGAIRLPAGAAIRFRKPDDTGDRDGLELTAGDALLIGGPSVSSNRVTSATLGASSTVKVAVAGADRLVVDSARAELLVPELRFERNVTAPVITQESSVASSSVGQPLMLRAQPMTGSESTGGSLLLRSASGTEANGVIEVQDASGGSIITFSEDEIAIANSCPVSNLASTTWKKLLSDQTRSSTITPTLIGDLSVSLEPGNYTFRVHLIITTPSTNNGGVRIGGSVTGGASMTNVSRLGSMIRVNGTSSSLVFYQHSTNMTGVFANALTTSATYRFVAEGAFTMSSAGGYEVTGAQNSSASGATTFELGSYVMFNKCEN